jgi:hypothetical protein
MVPGHLEFVIRVSVGAGLREKNGKRFDCEHGRDLRRWDIGEP